MLVGNKEVSLEFHGHNYVHQIWQGLINSSNEKFWNQIDWNKYDSIHNESNEALNPKSKWRNGTYKIFVPQWNTKYKYM